MKTNTLTINLLFNLLLSSFTFFYFSSLNAQTGDVGFTLIISAGSTSTANSSLEQYSTSKTRTFDIPGEYKMMQVGPTYTTNTNVGVYRYLNEAVNQALTW
ncbi:hypothetical protein, partial [Flavobacterium branchiophilum]